MKARILDTYANRNNVDGCIILSCSRGKLNTKDIYEGLNSCRSAEGAYFQIYPVADDELDPHYFDDGDQVILYPVDAFLGAWGPRMVARDMIYSEDGKPMCPVCCNILPDDEDMEYCPYCGQALAREEKK